MRVLHPAVRKRCVSFFFRASFFCVVYSGNAFSEANRADYDLDDDGLIEINDREDFLAIPDSFYRGAAQLYGVSAGCPEGLCTGYELSADIDFGNLPVATVLPQPFLMQQVFEGNGHTLANLSYSSSGDNGLFGEISESVIRNLVLDNVTFTANQPYYMGTLTPIAQKSVFANIRISNSRLNGQHYTGGLIGVAHSSTLIDCHFSGVIDVDYLGTGLQKGGLIGSAQDSIVYASSARGEFITGNFPATNNELGGLVGATGDNTAIIASFAQFTNLGENAVGHLVPNAYAVSIQHSYAVYSNAPAASDAADVVHLFARPTGAASVSDISAVQVADLSCPQSAKDPACAQDDLLAGFTAHTDSIGQPVWQFGTANELPVIADGLVFLTSDSDGDFKPDLVDAFPADPAAALDMDRDGKADSWNINCDEDCRANSVLREDDVVDLNPKEGEPQPQAGGISLYMLVYCCLFIALVRKKLGVHA